MQRPKPQPEHHNFPHTNTDRLTVHTLVPQIEGQQSASKNEIYRHVKSSMLYLVQGQPTVTS